MDLLQVSRVINTELTQISLYFRDVLDQQEAVAIFNSVVTCITDDLANTFSFTVSDRREPSHTFVKWGYDLNDKGHINRTGQDLQDIIILLKHIPSGTAQLICDVEWSGHFFDMDKVSQERFFRSTYWGKKAEESQKKAPLTKPSRRSPREPTRLVDLQLLELDLLKMETETEYIDTRKKDAIYESAKTYIQTGYCRGIHFEMLDDDRRVLEWGYEVSPDLRLVRTGDDREQVLAILRKQKGNLSMQVSPLVTRRFEELLPKEKQEVMKDMIWAPLFKKKGWFG